MFIVHGDKLRRNARWIMAGVLLLIIPSFIMLFTISGNEQRRQDGELPTIRGKAVDPVLFTEMKNMVRASYVVMQGREVRRTPEMLDRIKQDAVLQLLLDQKAKEMGVQVTDAEVGMSIQNSPIFLNEAKQFDRERFQQFKVFLNNLGITEAMFAEIVRSQLRRSKLQMLVSSAAQATPLEVQQTFMPLNEKLTVDLIQFDLADHKASVTVSNEEARAYYEQNLENFRLPAKVKVRYAEFAFDKAKSSIQVTEEEIADFFGRNPQMFSGTNNVSMPLEAVKPQVQEKLISLRAERAAGDQANSLALKLAAQPGQTNLDFTKLAAELGATIKETDFFSPGAQIPGISGAMDFAQKAFALTPEQPYSDPATGTNAYYVLEYLDNRPSVVPAFEDVAATATEQIKRAKAYDATISRARELQVELKKLIDQGKTFEQAATQLKLKFETSAPFTVSENVSLPAGERVQQETLGMPVGAISSALPTATGAVIFHLRDRKPADLAEFDAVKERIAQQVLQRNRQALYNDWLKALVESEKVDFKIKPRQLQTEDAELAN